MPDGIFCDMRPRIHKANQKGCNIQLWGSNRSIGKTYSTKQKMISDYLKKGRSFLYLRRNRKSLDPAMKNFFVDVGEEFPSERFKVKGNTFYHVRADRAGKDILEPMGQGFCLMDAEVLKGTPYENMGTILLEEMIPENGKYLNISEPLFEPQALSSIYMSVARARGVTAKTDVNLICLYNAFTDYTPYYSYFGINIAGRNIARNKNVYCEIIDWQQSAETYQNAAAFSGILDSNYGKAAVNGQRILDNQAYITKPVSQAVTWFYLYFYGWYRFSLDNIDCYVSAGNDATFPNRYTLMESEDSQGVRMFTGNIRQAVRQYIKNGRLYYDSGHTKSILQGVLK